MKKQRVRRRSGRRPFAWRGLYSRWPRHPNEAAHPHGNNCRLDSLALSSDQVVLRVSPCLYLDERRSPRGRKEHVRSRTVRQTHWRSRRLVRRWRCASTGSIPGWACATYHGFGGRLLLFLLLAEVHLSAGGWLPGGSKFLPFSPFLLSLSVFLSLPLPFLSPLPPPFFPLVTSPLVILFPFFSFFSFFYSSQPGHSARPTFANDQTRAPVSISTLCIARILVQRGNVLLLLRLPLEWKHGKENQVERGLGE